VCFAHQRDQSAHRNAEGDTAHRVNGAAVDVEENARSSTLSRLFIAKAPAARFPSAQLLRVVASRPSSRATAGVGGEPRHSVEAPEMGSIESARLPTLRWSVIQLSLRYGGSSNAAASAHPFPTNTLGASTPLTVNPPASARTRGDTLRRIAQRVRRSAPGGTGHPARPARLPIRPKGRHPLSLDRMPAPQTTSRP
jgi:hypothetical protein